MTIGFQCRSSNFPCFDCPHDVGANKKYWDNFALLAIGEVLFKDARPTNAAEAAHINQLFRRRSKVLYSEPL